MRENAAAKARRYLVDGRVLLRRVTDNTVLGFVRGDGAVYRVTADPAGWRCDCPARGRCAHQIAVALVTAPSSPGVPVQAATHGRGSTSGGNA
jgi:uncharacterized Zn finger protein